ncbi:PEP-CTERM sorting domain-containing protein [bacterium]|nr:PEP-CTERM sorting domain-containing protein [bacterium]
MIRRTWVARLFAAAAAAVAVGGTAAAGIIPASVTVTPEAGNFRWQYAVVLPTDMKLQAGDYFTIYDFGGLVGGSQFMDPVGSSASDWTMEVVKAGPVPAGLNPNDDPTIDNLVFRYTGSGILTGQTGLGNFGAVSTVGTSTKTDFTAQNPQGTTGELDRNIVDTIAPGVPTDPGPTPGVPEPATLLLAAIGIPAAGAARALRKRKA